MRALVMLIAAAVLTPTSAAADDFDSRWIGETLGERRPRVMRSVAKPRPPREPRATKARHERKQHRHEAPKHQPERIDVVEREEPVPRAACLQPITAISHEKLTAENAWEDAQRAWQNAVRWTYGERFMAISHAASVTRICNISASAQNATGRIGEVVRDAIGTEAGGNRWRCEITAQPCMAPREPGGPR